MELSGRTSHRDLSGPTFAVSRRFLIVLLAAGVCAWAISTRPAVVHADSRGFFQQPWNKDDGNTLAERRRQRELIQEALRARLEPELRSTVPYVSDSSINALQLAIARYRAIVQAGGWPTVPEDRTLQLHDSGDAVVRLRHRLWLSGDLTTQTRREWRFDSDLEMAVARFQLRHGLSLTGFADIRTRRALNIPADQRLRQLEINLARLTELMKVSQAERYVLVNVPAFTLQAVQNGQLVLESGVVTGKPSRQTPSVSALIKELNFYPYWRVPDSIAHKDLIPQIRKDPSYFHEQNFSLLPTWGAQPIDPAQINWMSPDIEKYKFRQDPGQHNALGVVRINMPNKHDVYLHDTPLKDLFARTSRAFSSGCVRVQRVLDLANWLLEGDSDWTPLRVQITVAQGRPEDVKLRKPVPVHFVYITAWASGQGVTHFRPDIYARDGVALEVAENQDERDGPPARSVTP